MTTRAARRGRDPAPSANTGPAPPAGNKPAPPADNDPAPPADTDPTAPRDADPAGAGTAQEPASHLELVTVSVGGTEVALPIEGVRQIMSTPAALGRILGAGEQVQGMVEWRGRIVPVLCLRRLLGLPDRPPEGDQRIVVVSRGPDLAGLAVGAVREVLSVPAGLVTDVAEDEGGGATQAVCRVGAGRRLVPVLRLGWVFAALAGVSRFAGPEPAHGGAVGGEPAGPAGGAAGGERVHDPPAAEGCWLVFRIDEEEYALDTDVVQEIVRVPAGMVRVPRAAPAITGMINLRGAALPILDLRILLDLAPMTPDDRQRVVVVDAARTRAGLLVDAVTELIHVAAADLRPVPAFARGGVPIGQVVVRPGHRVVLLLRAEPLVAPERPGQRAPSSPTGNRDPADPGPRTPSGPTPS
jgi:purine-binding chemotaxis protein CheW